GAIEGWAEHGRIGHLTAITTAHTALVDGSDGIVAQWIVQLLDRQGRAARQAHAGMVARADVLIDAEARFDDALAGLHRRRDDRLFAPLPVEHAFRRGDDDLGTLLRCRQSFLQRVAHLAD